MSNGNYDKDDIARFEAKDYRISKMNCLNRATDLIIAMESALEGFSVDKCTNRAIEIADIFMDYLYSDSVPNVNTGDNCGCDCTHNKDSTNNHADKVDDKDTKSGKDYPVPTTAQVNVMVEIAKQFTDACEFNEKVDFDALTKAIYDEFGKYPANKNSINVVLGRINKKNFIVEI